MQLLLCGWVVGQVSGVQVCPSKVDLGRKGGGPAGLFCAQLQGGPQETDTQWHRCSQRGEIGSKHRWTLDGQGVSQGRRAGGPKVSQHRWSLGTPRRRGQ